jgi:two-component system cell cycle sensor histidine kinase PleC
MNKKRILKITARQLVITISVISTLFVAILFERGRSEYNDALKYSKSDLMRLVHVMSSNVELNLVSVDQTLQRAVERQYFNMLFGKTMQEDMERNLALWANTTPHVEAIMIMDENNAVEIEYKKADFHTKIAPINDHFEMHKDSNGDLFISASEDGTNHIIASRRIEKLDGNFGGYVVAIIDANYITNFLSSVERGKNTKVGVVLDKGSFLVGEQDNAHFKAVLDTFNSTNGPINIEEKNIDNRLKIFSSEHLKNFPITVMLEVDEDDIFRSWRANRNSYIVFAVIFAGFVATVIFFMTLLGKKMKYVKESEIKALTASQTKSDFLAKMSHELRTPLNAIIGFSEMLSSGYFGKVTSDQVERLNDINMCGNHLLELINDILDFSKGEAGKLTLKEEVVDLYAVVGRAFRILEQKAKKGNIDLVNAVPREFNSIYADGRKIKQILINLLSNSVKFTPEGGKIIVSTHFDKAHNLVITVSDTGRGIESKDIPKAMAVFEQVHGDSIDEGTGLGLPLCQMFTEMHGGSFRLESKVGVGTTAYATIPQNRVRKPVFEEAMEAV